MGTLLFLGMLGLQPQVYAQPEPYSQLQSMFGLENQASADWTKVKIPKAKCALDQDYHVFIRRGDPRKVTFHFMGGGACWSFGTCFFPRPRSILIPLPGVVHFGGILSSDSRRSPITDHTVVYLPYCSGDVFLGKHKARYGGIQVRHEGRKLVEKTLAHLDREKLIDYSNLDEVVAYGFSAGAIGALFHMKTLEEYLPPHTKRTLLSDSPGMHFGKTFWEKFPYRWFRDIRKAIAELGHDIDPEDGNMGPMLPTLCRKFPQWDIGILQGSRDIVMALMFGDISLGDHERLLHSRKGMIRFARTEENCSVWVPRTAMHTFLIAGPTARMTAGKRSAEGFMHDLVLGDSRQSHVDELPRQ